MSVEVGEVLIVMPFGLSQTITEWLSGDRSQEIEWSTTSDKNLIYHKVELQNPATFNEINSQADWGTLYYAMGNVSVNGTVYISLVIVDDLGW